MGIHAFSTTADPVGTSRTRSTCEKQTVLTAESSKVSKRRRRRRRRRRKEKKKKKKKEREEDEEEEEEEEELVLGVDVLSAAHGHSPGLKKNNLKMKLMMIQSSRAV